MIDLFMALGAPQPLMFSQWKSDLAPTRVFVMSQASVLSIRDRDCMQDCSSTCFGGV